MRWPITLFAAYLLLLAVLPCGDAGLSASTTDASLHLPELVAEHDHPEPAHDDHCTLFCICTCCNTVVGTPSAHLRSYAESPPLPPAASSAPTSDQHWKPLLAADGPWQPPRV